MCVFEHVPLLSLAMARPVGYSDTVKSSSSTLGVMTDVSTRIQRVAVQLASRPMRSFAPPPLPEMDLIAIKLAVLDMIVRSVYRTINNIICTK